MKILEKLVPSTLDHGLEKPKLNSKSSAPYFISNTEVSILSKGWAIPAWGSVRAIKDDLGKLGQKL